MGVNGLQPLTSTYFHCLFTFLSYFVRFSLTFVPNIVIMYVWRVGGLLNSEYVVPKKGQMQIKGKLTGRQKAQRKYNSKPEQRKRRAERNATRAKLEKAGKVRKGDGKDIDHKNHKTGDMRMSNLQVLSASLNRKDGGPGALSRGKASKKRKKK